MIGVVETECTNCGKKIYVQKQYIREKMFCTLGCMDSYAGEAYEQQENC